MKKIIGLIYLKWSNFNNFKLAADSALIVPPRPIKIHDEMKEVLEIEFDIDLGLLTRMIPSKELFNEIDDMWNWEEEFSKLSADFTTQARNKAWN